MNKNSKKEVKSPQSLNKLKEQINDLKANHKKLEAKITSLRKELEDHIWSPF